MTPRIFEIAPLHTPPLDRNREPAGIVAAHDPATCLRSRAARLAGKLVALFVLLLFASHVQAQRTFYISSSSGSNSNNGTSTSTPWKSVPYMNHSSACDGGAAPTYTHQNGDRFLFKGGDTWPAGCFEMTITLGGSASAQDYYGVCLSTDSDSPCSGGTSWPSSAWTRPKFDLAQAIPTGNHVITVTSGFSGYTTFDNIEIANQGLSLGIYGADDAYNFAAVTASMPGVLIENGYIHDWISNTNVAGQPSNWAWMYSSGAIFDGSNRVVISQMTIEDSGGWVYNGATKVTGGFGGACENCQEVKNSTFYSDGAACYTVSSCHDNEMYNFSTAQNLFDLCPCRPHSQIIEDDYTADTDNPSVYNNYVHDSSNVGVSIYVPYHANLYNNVLVNTSQYILLGAYPGGDSSSRVGYVYNNTVDCSSGGNCLAMDSKTPNSTYTALGTLYLRNNIWITNGTPTCIGVSGCNSITTLIQSNNTPTMTTTEASTYGFIAGNKYSPSSSDPNVAAQGMNLTSSCTGSFASLCQDASGAAWFGGAFKTRPTGSAGWDRGAFQGQGGGGSTGPPSTSISSPSPGAVSGSVNLTASCTPQGSATVGSIQFAIDGSTFGAAGTASPYTLSWNTLTAANGAHTIGAVCTDSNGQTGTAGTVTVTVSNSMPGCFVSGNNTNWNTYQAFTTQSGTFTATFTATPNTANQDSVIGLSQSPATAYGNMAAIIRFNSSGDIDAYQGSIPGYTAVNTAPYSAGTAYTFSMTVNIGAGIYSVSETSPSSIVIATNYAFRPTAAASSLSYVNAASDNTTPDTVQLCNFQIGGTASLTFSPAGLSFGNVTVGGNSTQTITSTTSGGSVTFTSVAISGNADFTIASNACTGSIPSSCATQIQFAPTSAALESATVTYTDSATGSPQTVTVSGTGVPATPTLSVSPASLNFGGVQIHTTSSSGPIVLTISSGPVTFTGTPSLSGANAADFALASNTCTGSVSAASCQTVVSFTPSVVSAESATLSYTDDATGSPQSVALTGTGFLAPHPPTAVHATVQ